ncbi:MAG: acetyl-CoA carboxylase biotin carboxyl carrier protein [Hyphomicrobiales bacterium]
MPSKKKAPAAKPAPQVAGDPELDLISRLADILNKTGLSEIELDRNGTRVRVSKQLAVSASIAPAVQHHAPAQPVPVSPSQVADAAPKSRDADHPGTVKSPMVGTVYRASTPGAAPFVEVGSTVKEGQTLLIIEAMKTMNQIPSPRDGRVTHVFVDNGHPVEFGEPLVVIE